MNEPKKLDLMDWNPNRLSRREYFAGLAMSAIITSKQNEEYHSSNMNDCVTSWAVDLSDALIKVLDKTLAEKSRAKDGK